MKTKKTTNLILDAFRKAGINVTRETVSQVRATLLSDACIDAAREVWRRQALADAEALLSEMAALVAAEDRKALPRPRRSAPRPRWAKDEEAKEPKPKPDTTEADAMNKAIAEVAGEMALDTNPDEEAEAMNAIAKVVREILGKGPKTADEVRQILRRRSMN